MGATDLLQLVPFLSSMAFTNRIVSFTVNFIMGVGVLSLPYAFYHTGLVLSPIFVLIISFLSYMTVMYIFEVRLFC